MQVIVLRLAIPADEYLRLYQGAVRDVLAMSEDGRRIRFPADRLRPFVTHDGVYGRFALHVDDRGKLARIERLR